MQIIYLIMDLYLEYVKEANKHVCYVYILNPAD